MHNESVLIRTSFNTAKAHKLLMSGLNIINRASRIYGYSIIIDFENFNRIEVKVDDWYGGSTMTKYAILLDVKYIFNAKCSRNALTAYETKGIWLFRYMLGDKEASSKFDKRFIASLSICIDPITATAMHQLMVEITKKYADFGQDIKKLDREYNDAIRDAVGHVKAMFKDRLNSLCNAYKPAIDKLKADLFAMNDELSMIDKDCPLDSDLVDSLPHTLGLNCCNDVEMDIG